MNKSILKSLCLLSIVLMSYQGMAMSLPPSGAETDSIEVRGCVMDSFTRELLSDTHIEVLTQDSVLIDEVTTNEQVWNSYGFRHNIDKLGGLRVPRNQWILFRCTKKGYRPTCVDYFSKSGKRETYTILPHIFMVRIPASRISEHQLREAVVTASKIRMVVKGDTVEWNADAFQLQNGSMLDGLLRLLPGFSIHGGQISVNGEIVSSLLVNGEHFFRGDPRVALENLPSYMVDKVQTYRKEPDYNYITHSHELSQYPLVVDVRLKKQYSIGWTANAEVGVGTSGRYMARAFGLRFTTNSRLTAFYNSNNTNDTREPGTSGDWAVQSTPGGKNDLIKGGVEALVKDKDGRWKYTGDIKGVHQKNQDVTYQLIETFSPLSNSMFGRKSFDARTRNAGLQSHHHLELHRQSNYLLLGISGAASHQNHRGEQRSGEFSAAPIESYRGAVLDSLFLKGVDEGLSPITHAAKENAYDALLVNSSHTQSSASETAWQTSLSLQSFVKIPHTPDYFNAEADVQVQHRKTESFSDFRYDVSALSQSERRYNFLPQQDFTVSGHVRLAYTYKPSVVHVTPYYDFRVDYADKNAPRYRLDVLGDDETAFGVLPSSYEALLETLDVNNSVWTRRNTMRHTVGFTALLYWHDYKYNVSLQPTMVWQYDRLSYHRNELNLFPRRNQCLFEPEVSYGFDDFRISYNVSHSQPNIISMQPYRDDADPLNIRVGNTELRTAVHHKVEVYRSFRKRSISKTGNIKAYWNMTQRALAYSQSLDETTGIRTYQSRNVNGNWSAGGSFNFGRRLDKQQHFLFNNEVRVDYQNSVDYVTNRSSVRNVKTTERFRLDMCIRKVTMNVTLQVRHLYATSHRSQWEDVNSFDMTYSLGGTVPLPQTFSASFQLSLLECEGYNDPTMNDLRFVANAQINKQFLQGKLRVSLQGFDIFHGLSQISKVVNAQGNVETWRNTLPAYLMLRVGYRFDMKKKN